LTPPNSTQLKVLQTGAMRTRLDSSPRKNKPEKRQCAEPGCDTLLCSFNEAETCGLHRGWPTSPVTAQEHRDTFVELLDDGFDVIDKAEGKT
jgi:hypothetical protein